MKKMIVLMLALVAFAPAVDACDCGCSELANEATNSAVGRLRIYNQCIEVCPDPPCLSDIEALEDQEPVPA